MNDDRLCTTPYRKPYVNGSGEPVMFICLGCNNSRIFLGSKGVGAMKRCSSCVEKREARKAAAAAATA